MAFARVILIIAAFEAQYAAVEFSLIQGSTCHKMNDLPAPGLATMPS
jgi:hypothetical protein